MTWANVLTTGSGKLEFRLLIEGLAYEFVTSTAMQKTVSGRERMSGLQRDGLRFEENVSLAHAEMDATGMTVSIVDRQSDSAATKAFAYRPDQITFVTSDISATALTIPVLSTSGFDAAGQIHIGTETLNYSSAGGAQFNITGPATTNRGFWDTIAQKHTAADGDKFTAPAVSNRPFSIEGRRATLYVYGEGDSLTGDGTAIWRGVCVTDAALSDNGSVWSLTIDPITSLFQQDFGTNLAEPAQVRGIYYPANYPFMMIIGEGADATRESAIGNRTIVLLIGHWESQRDFCLALSAQILTETGSWATWTGIDSMIAEPLANPSDGWLLKVRTTATPRWPIIEVLSEIELGYRASSAAHAVVPDDGSGATHVVTASKTYTIPGDAGALAGGQGRRPGAGTVPRGVAYTGDPPNEADPPVGSYASSPGTRLHFQSSSPIVSPTALELTYVTADRGTDITRTAVVKTSDADKNWVTIDPDFGGPVLFRPLFYTREQIMSAEFTNNYANGHFADFLEQVFALAITDGNIGRVPFIVAEDFDSQANLDTAVLDAARGRSFALNRRYVSHSGVEFLEVFTHECRLLSLFPAMTSTGTITLRPLRIPTGTDPATAITRANVLVDQGFPSWERHGQYGAMNLVRIKTVYDAGEEDHVGTTFVVRDATSLSINKVPRELEIAPLSEPQGTSSIFDDHRDAVEIARPIFGLFGAEYAVVRIDVPLSLFGVLVGDIVTVTADSIPDVTDGTRSVAALPGIVIGRSWELDRGRGNLSLVVFYNDVAGYAPSVTISSESGAGVNWTLTVSTTDPDGVVEMLQTGQNISDHFAAGDQISTWKWDSASPTRISGEVDSVTDPATIVVTFDSTWTPSGDDVLGFDVASQATTAQQAYAYISSTAARVAFSTARRAFEFSA